MTTREVWVVGWVARAGDKSARGSGARTRGRLDVIRRPKRVVSSGEVGKSARCSGKR